MTQNPPAPLDRILTADEAAERLRISTRAIIKLGRDIGACSRFGRLYLFSERDLLDIWQALRAPPISYYGRAVHIPASKSPLNVYKSLQELTCKKKSPGRLRWEKTYEKQTAEREATKEELAKWKDTEPLDRANRDPAYWTRERKERLRLERLARKKGWLPR